MTSIILSHKNKIFVFLLTIFSVIINQYYGNKGIFPIDSFHFFDSGYRILKGEVPFLDYWVVKGPLLDYLQAGFFYIFGENWQAYVFHASFFNAFTTLATFYVLKTYKLKTNLVFLYSLSFCILAYPSSGTPFIDHHSAFFSLLAVYSFLLAINSNKRIYWILIPVLLSLSFLSKQVPAGYVIISLFFTLVLYFYIKRNIEKIKYLVISSILFIFFIICFGVLNGINFSDFTNQFFLYPQTIGSLRFSNLDFSLKNIIENFIIIYAVLLPLFFINFKNALNKKKYFYHNQFFTFTILFLFTLSLILHQLLTKNQTFIFFLIPILAAFSHQSFQDLNFKFKKIISIFLILTVIFATFKYHLRFNEGRKFHELESVNFDLAIKANEIHENLSGLKWITPHFPKQPSHEINQIKQILNILENDKGKKMVISNYPIFSLILKQKLFSPSRVYTGDGTTHPLPENRFYKNYEILMQRIIDKNNIETIYMINITGEDINFSYLNSYKNCDKKNILVNSVEVYNLKKCK